MAFGRGKKKTRINEQQDVAEQLATALTTDSDPQKIEDSINNVDNGIDKLIDKIKEIKKDEDAPNRLDDIERLAGSLNTNFSTLKGLSAKDYNLLDNALMSEIKSYKDSDSYKNLSSTFQNKIFEALRVKLTAAERTQLFLRGMEREAGLAERKELDELLSVFGRIRTIIRSDFERLKTNVIDANNIRELIKAGVQGVEKKQVKTLMVSELAKIESLAESLMKGLRFSKNDADSPIYQKLMTFTRNIMLIFDQFDDVCEVNDIDTSFVDAYNEKWDKKHQKFEKRWMKSGDVIDRLKRRVDDLHGGLVNFVTFLNTFVEVSKSLTSENETENSITKLLAALIDFKLRPGEEGKIKDEFTKLKKMVDAQASMNITGDMKKAGGDDLNTMIEAKDEKDLEAAAKKKMSSVTAYFEDYIKYSINLGNKVNELISLINNIGPKVIDERLRLVSKYNELAKDFNNLFNDTQAIINRFKELLKAYDTEVQDLYRLYGNLSGDVKSLNTKNYEQLKIVEQLMAVLKRNKDNIKIRVKSLKDIENSFKAKEVVGALKTADTNWVTNVLKGLEGVV